jgi:hypothetical protein
VARSNRNVPLREPLEIQAFAGGISAPLPAERLRFSLSAIQRPRVLPRRVGHRARCRQVATVSQAAGATWRRLLRGSTARGGSGHQCAIPHGFGHIDADRAAMRTNAPSSYQQIGAGAAIDIENRFARENWRNRARVGNPRE